jgi:hypothetical protein
MITNEFKYVKIYKLIESSQSLLYGSNTVILTLNMVVLAGFVLNFMSAHNLAFSFTKPGDPSKLKPMLIHFGVPLFSIFFLISYLTGAAVTLNIKLLIELLIIIVAYVELAELEREVKDHIMV